MSPKHRLDALRFLRWGLAALATLLLAYAAGQWARQQELQLTTTRLRQATEAYVLALRGIVERYSDLPYVAARQPAVQALLLDPSPTLADPVNRYLADLQQRTGAEDLYIVDARGLTIAASNWDQAGSFVGQSYRQRPYFEDAIAGRRGLFYGIGLTTGQPGLFIAEPIRQDGRILGVGVVKLGLERLAQAWPHDADPVVLQDSRGIVFLSSVPEWLYHGEQPLGAADLDWLREHWQYGARQHFDPLPWQTRHQDDLPGPELIARWNGQTKDLLALRTRLPELGWTLTVTGDLRKVRDAREWAQAITGLTAIALLLGSLYWRQRSKRLAERRQAQREREDEARQREQERRLQISARLASVGEMASTLAHELNQPLMALSNFAHAARNLAEQDQKDMLRQALDEIVEQATRASDIVRRVRAFINPQRSSYASVDLNDCVRHALAILQPELRREHIACKVLLAENLPAVRADSVLLEQVLVNLIQNAVQVMRDTPAERREICITTDRQDGSVSVAVADRGPGVPDSQKDQIFTPFYTTREEGLGLGLNICRTIVEAHGGRIAVSTPDHGGAVFTFTLPAET